jgi:hypothetical protein
MSTEDARSPTTGAGRPAERWPARLAEIALIVAVFSIVGGAPPPHVNESHYLTKAKHYWDPSYCPGDFFLDSADPHLTFYWTFGWLTRLCSLTATAWIGRAAVWLAIALAWRRLSRTIVNRPWVSVLGAAVWLALIEKANFAGEWVVGGVEAKCLAYAFLLGGLSDLARGNWRTPWVWFGAASAFHVLVGAWAVIAALGVWVAEPRGRRTSLLKLAPGLLIGGLLSLPGLLPALALERGVDPAVTLEAAQIYVFDRLPHHLSPLTLPAAELQLRLTRFGLMSAGFIALWAWANGQSRKAGSGDAAGGDGRSPWLPLDRIMRLAGVALACNCIGLAIEAALWQHPESAARILRYYWFRQADVAVPLAVALGICSLVTTMLEGRVRGGIPLTTATLAACGWVLAGMTIDRVYAPSPPAANKIEDFPSWRAACEWIRDYAPPDARVLVPRTGQSFKWYASRADVVNYKDVPQDAASVVEWRRRCRELFPVLTQAGVETMHASPEQWGGARVLALARKYGASHVLARSFPPLGLPVAYPPSGDITGSFYVVYETGVPPTEARP